MKLAVVQVRGILGMNRKFRDTLKLLKLTRKNSCVVVDNNPIYLGMLDKLKDYITWGEIDPDTFKLLLEKRGKITGDKSLTEAYLKDKVNMNYDSFSKSFLEGKLKLKDVPGMKTYFRLKPPVRGFEAGGIKTPYSMGGVLGYRKESINDLLRRMI